jgi:hypothetical protein
MVLALLTVLKKIRIFIMTMEHSALPAIPIPNALAWVFVDIVMGMKKKSLDRVG